MKKVILLILVFILGCSQERNEIETIEIMSYFYNLNDSQTEFKTETVFYSVIDKDGNVETVKKTPFSKKEYIYFKSTVGSEIIDKIFLNSKDKKEEFYNDKSKNPTVEISCGPTIRVKIKFKNHQEISFNTSDFKTNSKYIDFIALQNLIEIKYAEKNFITIEDTTDLNKKLNAFKKYSLHKDTLELPFPAMPKKNPIKFTK